jgi:ribosomal-protein-serine acetyltransferase
MLTRLIDEEVLLKPLETQDSDNLFALTDANRAYLRQWLPWLDSNKSVGDTLKFIETCVAQREKRAALHLSIRYRGEMAGVIGFHYFDFANRFAPIGYWLGEKFQGKGIITRSCRTICTLAFTELGINRIDIRCAVQNAKSRAIPERLRFVNEGTIRDGEWLYDHYVDLVVYGMLARHWPTG